MLVAAGPSLRISPDIAVVQSVTPNPSDVIPPIGGLKGDVLRCAGINLAQFRSVSSVVTKSSAYLTSHSSPFSRMSLIPANGFAALCRVVMSALRSGCVDPGRRKTRPHSSEGLSLGVSLCKAPRMMRPSQPRSPRLSVVSPFSKLTIDARDRPFSPKKWTNRRIRVMSMPTCTRPMSRCCKTAKSGCHRRTLNVRLVRFVRP